MFSLSCLSYFPLCDLLHSIKWYETEMLYNILFCVLQISGATYNKKKLHGKFSCFMVAKSSQKSPTWELNMTRIRIRKQHTILVANPFLLHWISLLDPWWKSNEPPNAVILASFQLLRLHQTHHEWSVCLQVWLFCLFLPSQEQVYTCKASHADKLLSRRSYVRGYVLKDSHQSW